MSEISPTVQCPSCGCADQGNYCSQCGARLNVENASIIRPFLTHILSFDHLAEQLRAWISFAHSPIEAALAISAKASFAKAVSAFLFSTSISITLALYFKTSPEFQYAETVYTFGGYFGNILVAYIMFLIFRIWSTKKHTVFDFIKLLLIANSFVSVPTTLVVGLLKVGNVLIATAGLICSILLFLYYIGLFKVFWQTTSLRALLAYSASIMCFLALLTSIAVAFLYFVPARIQRSIVAMADPDSITVNGPPPAGHSVPSAPPMQTGASADELRVGVLLPLSGDAAELSNDLLDAARLALLDTRCSTVKLVVRDTGDVPESATAAAQSAIDAGAELLLGPLYGRLTPSISPIAARHRISVISFSNDASFAKPGVYIFGFRPEEQWARIAEYATRRGVTRFAVLATQDTYGDRLLAAWQDELSKAPQKTTFIAEKYGTTANDSRAAISRLLIALRQRAMPQQVVGSAPNLDGLYISWPYQQSDDILSVLSDYINAHGSTIRLLGTMQWLDSPSLLANPMLQGAWIASPPSALRKGFAERFGVVYEREPASIAILGYDAMALACLMAEGGGRPDPEQLTDPRGFAGATGMFRLQPNGLTERGLEVVEVQEGTENIIDPAPESFQH